MSRQHPSAWQPWRRQRTTTTGIWDLGPWDKGLRQEFQLWMDRAGSWKEQEPCYLRSDRFILLVCSIFAIQNWEFKANIYQIPFFLAEREFLVQVYRPMKNTYFIKCIVYYFIGRVTSLWSLIYLSSWLLVWVVGWMFRHDFLKV